MICRACNGRGWHVGECHPREECGACKGSGGTDDHQLAERLARCLETACDGSPRLNGITVVHVRECATCPLRVGIA